MHKSDMSLEDKPIVVTKALPSISLIVPCHLKKKTRKRRANVRSVPKDVCVKGYSLFFKGVIVSSKGKLYICKYKNYI